MQPMQNSSKRRNRNHNFQVKAIELEEIEIAEEISALQLLSFKTVLKYSGFEIMKSYILFFSAIFLFCSFNNLQDVGKSIPSVKVKSLRGIEVDISKIENNGKPILILVFEITCKPCVSEFDNISDIYDDWQRETGVKIIAVSLDDSRNQNKLASFVTARGWQFEIFSDINQDFKRALSVPYCPYCFVIDSERKIVWEKAGYVTGDEDIIFDILKRVSKGEPLK